MPRTHKIPQGTVYVQRGCQIHNVSLSAKHGFLNEAHCGNAKYLITIAIPLSQEIRSVGILNCLKDVSFESCGWSSVQNRRSISDKEISRTSATYDAGNLIESTRTLHNSPTLVSYTIVDCFNMAPWTGGCSLRYICSPDQRDAVLDINHPVSQSFPSTFFFLINRPHEIPSPISQHTHHGPSPLIRLTREPRSSEFPQAPHRNHDLPAILHSWMPPWDRWHLHLLVLPWRKGCAGN